MCIRDSCRPIPVCPQSVVCVHGLYMSTVHFHTHTHTSLARSQCFHSAGQFLCVHCQWCVSMVCICPLFTFIHTLPKYHTVNAFSLLANSCVSTVSGVCPRSVYVHCSLSYTHYLSTTQSMPSLCWPSPVCPLSVVCVHSLYMSTVHFHTHTT